MVSIAIVGATGLVGEEFLKLINSSHIPFEKIYLFNSQKNKKDPILLKGKLHQLRPISLGELETCDFVFLMAGSDVSKEIIPKLKHPVCVDLSSAFRKDPSVPLMIPEINKELLYTFPKVIASPNCTTTIMLMALSPLHQRFGLKSIFASTYQAASGGGKKLLSHLLEETKRYLLKRNGAAEGLQYAFNVYPHPDQEENSSSNLEEEKMVFETKKILNIESLDIAVSCIRVPTLRVHGISLHAEFETALNQKDAIEALRAFPNLVISENPCEGFDSNEAYGKHEVYVSRVRVDENNPTRISLWVVGDQLLKGAAFNAFQILEHLASLQRV